MMEPKAKKKHKTKKEKEKDTIVGKLMIVAQTMVGDKLHDEKAQSLRDLVEEVAKLLLGKTKKKKMGKDEAGLSKAKAHKKILLSCKEGEKMR